MLNVLRIQDYYESLPMKFENPLRISQNKRSEFHVSMNSGAVVNSSYRHSPSNGDRHNAFAKLRMSIENKNDIGSSSPGSYSGRRRAHSLSRKKAMACSPKRNNSNSRRKGRSLNISLESLTKDDVPKTARPERSRQSSRKIDSDIQTDEPQVKHDTRMRRNSTGSGGRRGPPVTGAARSSRRIRSRDATIPRREVSSKEKSPRTRSPGKMKSRTSSPRTPRGAAVSPKRNSLRKSAQWSDMNARVNQLNKSPGKRPVMVSPKGDISTSQRQLLTRPAARPSAGQRQESQQLRGLLQKLRDPSQRNLMDGEEGSDEDEEVMKVNKGSERTSSRNLMRFMKPSRKAYGYQQDVDGQSVS